MSGEEAAAIAREALSTPCVEQDADEVGEHKRCPWCRSRPILESSMFANRSSYRSGCSNEACHVQPYAAGSSIAEAWERWDALSAIQNRDAGLRAALDGFGDDYITSDTHHPNWVLIPTKTFDRIRAALQMGGENHG